MSTKRVDGRTYSETVLTENTNTDLLTDPWETLSIQMTYDDATPADPVEFVAADVTPSVFATGTMQVLDYAALTGATITVAGHDLVEGADWDAEVDDDTTAANIAAAIHALTEVNAAASTDTVTITAATAGAAGNAIDISTDALPADLLLSGSTLEDGEDLSYIDATAHGFTTGLKAPLTGTNLPTGLSATDYWIIAVDDDTLRLASSQANAFAGTFVIISAAGTTNDAALTPDALDVDLTLAVSNDGEHWIELSSPTPKNVTAAGSTLWADLDVSMRYLRVMTEITAGAIDLDIKVNAKADAE